MPALPESLPAPGSHGQPDLPEEDSGDDPRLHFAGNFGRQKSSINPIRHSFGQVLAISERRHSSRSLREVQHPQGRVQPAIQGQSSGGIAAFNAAFNHPEEFSRVYTVVGSFTALQWKPGELDGGNIYPFKVRREAKRNLRVWMNDGSEDQEAPLGELAASEYPACQFAEVEGLRFPLQLRRRDAPCGSGRVGTAGVLSPGCGATTIRRRPSRPSSRAPRRRPSRRSESGSTIGSPLVRGL